MKLFFNKAICPALKTGIKNNRQVLGLCILLIIAALAVYGQVRHFDFVHIDDNIYVTENPNLKSGIRPDAIRWAFTTNYAEFWHPLTWLSLMADSQLYGLNAGGYHVTNLVLHLFSTLLLFLLFHRMTGEAWKSVFVAAFFMLHPLHVENVAWVSERKDVLSAFFWMLTLFLYVLYTEKRSPQQYALVLISFVLALFSKPMVVTLPCIMILLDYWPLKRFHTQKGSRVLWQVKEKLPFFVLSAAFSVITVFAQHKGAGRDLQFPLITRCFNAMVSFERYLEKTFWPRELAVFYPFTDNIPSWEILGAALLFVIMTSVVVVLLRRTPCLLTGWGWLVIAISPVIGVIPIGDFAMADRYHYIPSVGIAVMLAWGLPSLIQRNLVANKLLLTTGVVFLAVMSGLCWKQCGYWKNDMALFPHTLRVTKNNYLAHINLGYILAAKGNFQDAIAHYNRAIQIMPMNVMIYNNRGNAYAKSGQYELAMKDFDKAIELKPDYSDAYFYRADLYQRLGRNQKALEDLTRFLQLKPDQHDGYFNRGNINIQLGRYPQSIDDFSHAILLQPDFTDAYNNRAFVHIQLGNYQQALKDYGRAIALQPDYADAYNNRAFVHLNLGNTASACRDAKKSCELGNCATLQDATAKGLCR